MVVEAFVPSVHQSIETGIEEIRVYTPDLQWKRVSNLELSGPEANTLPLGHRGLTRLGNLRVPQILDHRNIIVTTPDNNTTMPLGTLFASSRLQVTIVGAPFLVKNPDGSLEGYVMDLVEQLSLVTGRRFQVQVVKDGYYGVYRNGRWNGMIGELVRNETDLVIADLTKTIERLQSHLFINLHDAWG
ncbi:hypothetical protein AVEN_234739-1 [Araneus ventricosus]|uniref:Ionotropic glutamate receptor L-glutamate and glycine-binding domain-containing protein n=1 Tax=Araneus ventricosus TaxID=182803 RepID=A0A4Y2TYI8_ARAVE|nr:hypothetical protein AVEN_234739-1 [Araneus ventricosus]